MPVYRHPLQDARGGRQLAVVIPVLIQRQADWGIVQVHGQHIRAEQRQQVLVRLSLANWYGVNSSV